MESSDLHYGHPRMPVSERAKIFMPFDPLKGFREALVEREAEADRLDDGDRSCRHRPESISQTEHPRRPVV